jgi:uncharacterized protein (DUF486 family)
MANPANDTKAFWTCAIITAVSAFISAGFSITALVGMNAFNTFAWYAASRSIALPLAVVAVIVVRSRAGLMGLSLAMALVQAFDAAIGFNLHDPGKTYGPLVLALVTFATLAWLWRTPKT